MDTTTPTAWKVALDRFEEGYGSTPDLTDMAEDVPTFLGMLEEVMEEQMVGKIREATARLLERPL